MVVYQIELSSKNHAKRFCRKLHKTQIVRTKDNVLFVTRYNTSGPIPETLFKAMRQSKSWHPYTGTELKKTPIGEFII